MSNPYRSTQQTALLYLLGFIYGWSLVAFLLWTAGFILIFCASAQPNPLSDRVAKPISNYRARLKSALYWMSDFDPKPRTYRIAEWMVWVYWLTFFAITLTYHIADYRWEGWIFVQHTVALGVALLATSAVVIYWLLRTISANELIMPTYKTESTHGTVSDFCHAMLMMVKTYDHEPDLQEALVLSLVIGHRGGPNNSASY